jgi:uncharacterized protein (TIGR03437 family)
MQAIRKGLLFCLSATSLFAQAPTIGAVINGLSNGPQLCPGVTAAVYGTNFGTNAANVSVTVGGKSAPIINATVTANQFSVEIPFELSAGASSMTVTVSGTASAAFPLTLQATAPAILTQNGLGTGPAAVFPVSGSNAAVAYTTQIPAHPGDLVVTYAVGLGQTNPATATGKAAATAPLATTPTITVGGVNAPVQFAGLPAGAVGVYQINFTVPAGLQGTQPLVITAGGQSSSGSVTLPLIGLTSLVNNASFGNAGTISPGSIATVFANSLGTTTDSGLPPNPTLFPATSKTGVQVTFNGTAAPLFDVYASGAQQQVDLLSPMNCPPRER